MAARAVIISLTAYIMFAGTIGNGELAATAVVIILVVFSAYILWDRARSI